MWTSRKKERKKEKKLATDHINALLRTALTRGEEEKRKHVTSKYRMVVARNVTHQNEKEGKKNTFLNPFDLF
jgi:hypothetical protein